MGEERLPNHGDVVMFGELVGAKDCYFSGGRERKGRGEPEKRPLGVWDRDQGMG